MNILCIAVKHIILLMKNVKKQILIVQQMVKLDAEQLHPAKIILEKPAFLIIWECKKMIEIKFYLLVNVCGMKQYLYVKMNLVQISSLKIKKIVNQHFILVHLMVKNVLINYYVWITEMKIYVIML